MSGKASFRAQREMLGLTQNDIARGLDVALSSVKRWENPDRTDYQVPEYAIEFLAEQRRLFDDAVNKALDALDIMGADGDSPVAIAIYRDAAHYADRGTVDMPYGMVNAISYECAKELSADGVDIIFYYPGYSGEMVEEVIKLD